MNQKGKQNPIIMVITYYADTIFMLNFCVDFFLLFLLRPERSRCYGRLLAAAAVGAGSALLLLYLFSDTPEGILFFLLRFLSAGTMVLIGFSVRGLGELLCNTALLYGMSGCFFGINRLVTDAFSMPEGATAFGLFVSAGVLLCTRALYSFRRTRNRTDTKRRRVWLRNGETELTEAAFYDSGNHLYEPISGKAVVLLRASVMKRLKLNPDMLRIVPYSAVGTKNGMLEAYPLEKLTIENGRKYQTFQHIYAAVAADEIFAQEACGVILHSEQSM